jgi:hypothetical protein
VYELRLSVDIIKLVYLIKEASEFWSAVDQHIKLNTVING